MKESEKPVSREMFYKAQKHHADLIKQLQEKIVKLVEVLEKLIETQ